MRAVEQRSPWIQLSNGRALEFDRPGAIPIEVVARSLARINRFTGHTRLPYNVGQHSVNVSYLVPKRIAAYGLLHDAGEAVTGDISTPLKNELDTRSGGWLRAFEERVHAAILCGLHMDPLSSADAREVKRADELVFACEVRDLMQPGERALLERGLNTIMHLGRIERVWSPEEAEARFLERWAEVKPNA